MKLLATAVLAALLVRIQQRLAVPSQDDHRGRLSIDRDGLRHDEPLLLQVAKAACPGIAGRAHGLHVIPADDSECPDRREHPDIRVPEVIRVTPVFDRLPLLAGAQRKAMYGHAWPAAVLALQRVRRAV